MGCHCLLHTIYQSLLKLMFIELKMPSNHLILFCPHFLLPSIFPSIRVFSNESVLLIRWPKYWGFSISPTNEYSGLISFRIDGLDLLAVQGTLKSILQHRSSKASILRCSAFFIVQLSHPNMTTRKTISSVQFSHSVMSDSVTPWTVTCQALLSLGFLRQEYWSIYFSRGSSLLGLNWVSCIGMQILYHWATWQPPIYMSTTNNKWP